jgi:hypothetical protein
MALPPIVAPPPLWSNQNIVLYHGTLTDFGPGFYATTVLRQARSWAAQIAATKGGGGVPAVIKITISRDALALLQTLVFARGDFHAKDYWSFVHYCRKGALDHNRSHPHVSYYDVVYGPVAAFWNQRMMIADADQISFHTPAAEAVLNSSAKVLIK